MNDEDLRLYTFFKIILWFIAAVAIIIVVYLTFQAGIYAQQQTTTKAPPPVTPVPSINPTPTSPEPNPQYLPQKAYVQLFAPENGIPTSSGTLPVISQVVPAAPVQQAGPSLGIPGLDIAAILALFGTGATYVKSHLIGKKTDKVEETAKENSKHIVEGTTVDSELARLLFEWNKEKADALNGTAPAVKLEALEDNTKAATETATKA